ncbi:MAG: M24 family metallopeptidase [Caldisphaera sp.]|uniref:M24 family metallopeptidase n=1 Tax=Caldisphaera sp. TaxID=2060322 RepID=UPI003D11733D
MIPMFQNRIEKLQQLMRKNNINLLIVNNRENLIYLTGLLEIECMAILIPENDEVVAITLSQDVDFVQENSRIKTIGYYFPKETLGQKIVEQINKFKAKPFNIGFERYFVDFEVYEKLRNTFGDKTFINASNLFYKARSVKENTEIDYIKKASEIVSIGMDVALKTVKSGISELDILAEAEYAMFKAGSFGSSFRPQIASGNRSLITHPLATDKKIQYGETVVIHLSSTYKGYCSKMSRTAYVGDIDNQSRKFYEMLVTIKKLLVENIKPGMSSNEVYLIVENTLKKFNYKGQFLEVIGYGIGLRQSEFYPIIGKNIKDLMEENMIISLLLPTIHINSNMGFKLEDVIWIKEKNNEILTKFPDTIINVS